MPAAPPRERRSPPEKTVGDDGATLHIRTGTRGDGVPALSPSALPVPAARQLPEHKGKVARINEHLTSLTEDVKSWVDLRVDLVKAEVDEKLELAKWGAAVGLFAAIGLWFLLLFAAFGIGALLGEYAYGFGIVMALLFITAAALFFLKVRPLLKRAAEMKKARYAAKRLS